MLHYHNIIPLYMASPRGTTYSIDHAQQNATTGVRHIGPWQHRVKSVTLITSGRLILNYSSHTGTSEMNQIVQLRETDPAEMGKTGTSLQDGEVSSHCFPQVSLGSCQYI
ncbi:hypothetical protein FOCG_09044 [Fusarium oxysporum f. sp. radicis-lycopersici 26381]|uniref:Uncharacterized protein n=1 Tax=Fusarium oxysporum Fo47 TaxID=660027 RepID=W9K4S8_FUSOX|nr:hypothetical protein FOZG_08451 [Fusarium oxysporum Fo47]EWZ83724.1 hypothetical protein FOWG_12659 [Fusarium oxysporum f. sp. lycopersici MN25]EXL50870.1 hypothetical protein FOCG_09044 [Fusarium oxysporum f. sp. radicis-lycopersici 26381]